MWCGAPVALALVITAVVLLIPGHRTPNSAPTVPEGPAQVVRNVPPPRLTAADRREIDAALDRFLPAAMERRNPTLAWRLAGPELKAGSTLAEWQHGSSPVPYYPSREQTFHDWQTIDVGPRYVIFNLLLHPAKSSKLATYTFSGEMVKVHGRWAVNRFYTIAIDNPITKTTHEIGPADFAPAPASPSTASSRLGGFGMVPAILLLSLILLIPLSFGAVAFARGRRFRKETAQRGASTDLPPLPSSYRQEPERPREPAGRP